MKKLLSLLVLLGFSIPSVYAASYDAFQLKYEIEVGELSKATVVSIDLPLREQEYGIAIEEQGTDLAQPWVSIRHHDPVELTVQESSPVIGDSQAFFDRDLNTSAEFDLDRDGGTAEIVFRADKEMSSQSLSLSLDDHVALPKTMTLSAMVDGKWKTVLSNYELKGSTVNFPETSSQEWKLNFTHAQPLRLLEINFHEQSTAEKSDMSEIRWLARPAARYTVYTQALSYSDLNLSERGQLQGEDLVVKALDRGTASENEDFVEPDDDEDGISNILDNCVSLANTDQNDVDNNGRGDACEDFDGDSIMNSEDNCPDHPNRYQEDEDSDGKGDACDGEESRMTEQNPWLPWAAMGITAVLILLIVMQTMKKQK